MTEKIDELVSQRNFVSTSNGNLFQKALDFQNILRPMKEAGIYPYFQPLEYNLGAEAVIRGKTVIMMGSNNYLGLTTHPKVREAAIEAIATYGTSVTGSRLLNGTLELHEAFEHEIAEFLGKEAALVFTTGYQTNLGIISALAGPNTTVFLDQYNHASIYDAVLLSRAKAVFFKHNSVSDLSRRLEETPAEREKFVIVDGVFSMEGDIAPLPEWVRLCREHSAALLVDDAHALGVIGPQGEGTAAHFGLGPEVDLIMATFSKSLASSGGYVAGSREAIEYIKHFGRSMIFSAGISPANLAAARAALQILIEEPERIQKLSENAKRLREGLAAMGWQLGASETPIIPLAIGDDLTTLNLWQQLLEAGVYVNPVVYPAVERNRAILRVSTIATHDASHLSQALDAFQMVGDRNRLFEKQAVNDRC